MSSQDPARIGRASDTDSFQPSVRTPRRRSVRRALAFECWLESDSWDGPVVLPATDISNDGLWLETPYALQLGDELVVSFSLPGSSQRCWAIAEVARVGLWRRRDDARSPGMGLVFTYCDDADRRRIAAGLKGRPPRLPRPRMGVAETARPPEASELPLVLQLLEG